MKCKRYEKGEIEFIRRNYGRISVSEIAAGLNRSYGSVSVKISKLGLSNKNNKVYP